MQWSALCTVSTNDAVWLKYVMASRRIVMRFGEKCIQYAVSARFKIGNPSTLKSSLRWEKVCAAYNFCGSRQKAMDNWSRFSETVAAIPQSLLTLKSVTDMTEKCPSTRTQHEETILNLFSWSTHILQDNP